MGAGLCTALCGAANKDTPFSHYSGSSILVLLDQPDLPRLPATPQSPTPGAPLRCCRFGGNIPDDWAKGNSFTRLKSLNLANNELTGTLPNFNRRGAWRALETLDMSANKFYGGLPTNWLGKYRPLKNIKYLDLSGNLLGTADGATAYTKQVDWCPAEGNLKSGSGWCPTGSPLSGTAASMVTLDLSNNGLVGEQAVRCAADARCGRLPALSTQRAGCP